MLTRALALGSALAIAALGTGCKCCNPCGTSCSSPALLRPAPAPCNTCPPGGPGVVIPPPPAAVGVAPGTAPFVPPPGPYGGVSFERNT
jgi:hypothetical protein